MEKEPHIIESQNQTDEIHEHEHGCDCTHSRHEHHHDHSHVITSLNTAFIIGIAINALYVIIEFTAGIVYNSVGLMSDAGHNLGDTASLILAMIAYKLAAFSSSKQYTYGFKKTTIHASLINAAILLVTVGFIVAASIQKFLVPQPLEGEVIAWVAGIGVIINAFTAWLFMAGKDSDLNIRGAFLHMLADTLVSVGVVISGIVISQTGLYIIDPIIGLTIAIVILISTWSLLTDSIRLALDGVPVNLDYPRIYQQIETVEHVVSIHHLHIWAISTTQNAMTAHVVIDSLDNMQTVKEAIKHLMLHSGIDHVTLEFELPDVICNDSCK